jgi:hypothetical protein
VSKVGGFNPPDEGRPQTVRLTGGRPPLSRGY